MCFYANSARDTFFMIMQCMNDVLKSLLYSSPSLHVQFCELAVQMMVWILVFGTARSKLVHHLRANQASHRPYSGKLSDIAVQSGATHSPTPSFGSARWHAQQKALTAFCDWESRLEQTYDEALRCYAHWWLVGAQHAIGSIFLAPAVPTTRWNAKLAFAHLSPAR